MKLCLINFIVGSDMLTLGISKWCTNNAQPPLEAFVAISKSLNVKMEDLIWNSDNINK